VGVTLEGQLVVAISSRALFDFEAENELFEQGDDRAYMKLQLERLEQPASPGVAFSLVRKLLAFNDASAQRVEVVILSRNDPVSGMRVFRSAQHYGLPIQRGSFTRGAPPWRYLKPLNANLFLSAHLSDVRAALDAGSPRRRSTRCPRAPARPTRTRCASPSTATPCSSATRPSACSRPKV
jgi:5'-nucleotidase